MKSHSSHNPASERRMRSESATPQLHGDDIPANGPAGRTSMPRLPDELANCSPRVTQLMRQARIADASPAAGRSGHIQHAVDSSPRTMGGLRHADKAVAPKSDNTGLPSQLKSGIEALSGYAMDDVKVHYNSDKPARLQAHAYAQRTDIHLAPGQEKYLPHEAWHLVQQKQGRVKPTLQMKNNMQVNDDAGLENEADVMGCRALQLAGEKASVAHENPPISTGDHPLQRFGIVKPKSAATTVPIEVQTQEELQVFTGNIGRLRQRLLSMAPGREHARDGKIKVARAQASLHPEIIKTQPEYRHASILQEAFQNLGKEDREYWLALENHADMLGALDKIVEKAEAGVASKGKPVNMRLFNIKIESLLGNDDDTLFAQVQELMKLAGGDRDFLVARNDSGEIPASFGLNCGSTIMDGFNSALEDMPGAAADSRTVAQKLGEKVNRTLMERIVTACLARFDWPADIDAATATSIVQAAVNYEAGRDDNLRIMYELMSQNAREVIKGNLASIYTYESVMEAMNAIVGQYANLAYKAVPMAGESAESAADLLAQLWEDLGFDGGDIRNILVENDDYTYSVPVSVEQLEAIAVAGGIVELSEPAMQNGPGESREKIDVGQGNGSAGKVVAFLGAGAAALPVQAADVFPITEGTEAADNIYFKAEQNALGSKWGWFDATSNARARDMFREALLAKAMQYLHARMPAANVKRFPSQAEFKETSPYKLSHANEEVLSIHRKVEAFLMMRG